MNSLKAKARRLVASGLFAIAMLPALASQPVAAVSMDVPQLECPEGTGVADLTLPLHAAPRMSLFFFRVDGGAWQQTDWYYTSFDHAWIWNPQSGWHEIPFYSDWSKMIFLSGTHSVDAWELRFTDGQSQWVNLGSCTTSDFSAPGIIITN